MAGCGNLLLLTAHPVIPTEVGASADGTSIQKDKPYIPNPPCSSL